MPAVAGDSMPVGKVPILKPSSAACFWVGVARGAPGDSTTNDGRPAAAATRAPDLRLVGGRVEEQDVGALLDVHLDARHGLVDALGRAAVGARQDEDAGLLGGLHGGADLHARLLARQAGLAGGGQRARRDLVLDQDGGGAGAAVGAHGALHVHGVAVAVIAVGQHQRLRRRAAHHVEGVEHLREGDEVEIGSAEPAGGDAGARQEGRLEAGAGGELGAEPVPDGRHDDEAGLGEERAQSVWWCHGLGFRWNGGGGWVRWIGTCDGAAVAADRQGGRRGGVSPARGLPPAHSLPLNDLRRGRRCNKHEERTCFGDWQLQWRRS